jgi:hypothetical protein
VVDISGNECKLSKGEYLELKVDRGSMGVISTALHHENQTECSQGDSCFNFPPLVLIKPPSSSDPASKKKSKSKKRKAASVAEDDGENEDGSDGAEVLITVEATWFQAKSQEEDNDDDETGLTLLSAMLQGRVLSADRVCGLSASFEHHSPSTVASGNLFGAAYAEGEPVLVIPSSSTSSTSSSSTSSSRSRDGGSPEFPSILVRVLGEDGRPSPQIDAQEFPSMLQLKCEFNGADTGGGKKGNGSRKKKSEKVDGTHASGEVVPSNGNSGGGDGNDNGQLLVRFSSKPIVFGVEEEDDANQEEEGQDEERRFLKVGEYMFTVAFTEARRSVLNAFKGATQLPPTQQAPQRKGKQQQRGAAASSSSSTTAALYGDGGSQLDEAELSVSRSFTVRVCPGAPRAVAPGNKRNSSGNSSLLLGHQKLTCSDRSDDDDARTLLTHCVLSLVDRGGSACTKESLRCALGLSPQDNDEESAEVVVPEPSVRCRIAADTDADDGGDKGAASEEAIPLLEGCDADGWLLCDSSEWSDSHGGNDHTFAVLRLQPAQGNSSSYQDGNYRLVFEAVSAESSLPLATQAGAAAETEGGTVRGVSSLEVLFELSTDAARVAAERERLKEVDRLEGMLEPLRLERDELRGKLEEAQEKAEEAERVAREAAGMVPPSYRRRLLSSTAAAAGGGGGGEDEEDEEQSQAPVRGPLPSVREAQKWLHQWRGDLQKMNSVVALSQDTAGGGSSSSSSSSSQGGGGGGLPGQRRPAVVTKGAAKGEFSAQG